MDINKCSQKHSEASVGKNKMVPWKVRAVTVGKNPPQNGYCQTLSRSGGWRYPASPSFPPVSSLVQCWRDPIRIHMTRKPTYHIDHAIVLEAAEESGGVHTLGDTK